MQFSPLSSLTFLVSEEYLVLFRISNFVLTQDNPTRVLLLTQLRVSRAQDNESAHLSFRNQWVDH